jgi:sugar-specific transcriptional regulator TrmB
MSINTTLNELGFNDKEIKVYLSLLENGKTTPSALSKLTKINRATVYNIAKGLQSKGVIAEDLGGKTLYFTALPAQNLEQIIKRPIRELQEKESLVKKAIEELGLITATKEYPVPRIRFVEENNLENFLYENIGVWVEDVLNTDSVWWGIQDYSFLEHYGKFNDWYWKQTFSKEAKMHLVGNESEAEREALKKLPYQNRDIHFSSDMKFTSSIWVGGDYLIMIVTRQHPFYLVEIHDKMLALNMREVFKKLWTESKSNK